MDAIEFLKTAKRRCENGKKEIYSVIDLEKIDIENYVKNIEEWGKNNPIKTRQMEFLKIFPGADVGEADGCLTLCPCNIYEKMRKECGAPKCSECRNEFWFTEVE